MNQKIILAVLIIVVVVIGAIAYSSDDSQDDEAMVQYEGDAMMEDDSMMASVGSYESYGPEKLVKADSGNVVLFFRASWCPSCKAVDSDIRAHLMDIPADLTILELDYDNSAELKKKYAVTSQHTFVQVDAQGNLIKKWLGSPTLAAVVSEVK